MEPGLYVTFFTEGESFESQLPPVGPLEHLIVRDRGLLADRRDVHQIDNFRDGSRWIEAELELQRALGNETGGARRPALRVGAPQGVYLRFASFDNSNEGEPVPELGPYAAVLVTPQRVEADGDILATRSGAKHPWELTPIGGRALTGIVRPDVAFRTRSTDYHPRLHQARPRVRSESGRPQVRFDPTRLSAPPMEPRPQRFREEDHVYRAIVPSPIRQVEAPQTPQPALTKSARGDVSQADHGASLRTRLGGDVLSRQTSAVTAKGGDRGAVNRRVAFITVGALLVGLVAFAALRPSGSSSAASVVSVGKPVSGPHRDYTIATVSRASQLSTEAARGVFLIVWVTVTNRDSAAGALSPRDFGLTDGGGVQYAPLPESSSAYQTDSNPGSPLRWTTSYPVGQPVSTPVIFDVEPNLRGARLTIVDVPAVQVRLD